MPSQRETNTMAEGLQKVLNEVTKMKVMPDSDLPFLVELETSILGYLRAPDSGQQQQPPAQPSGMDQMAPAMSQVMGGAPGPGMPNPDEFRRMVAQ